ncbi:hypothetical protein HLB42_16460 [Deinococcus sp. D7000]|nr:hypothetical protein HLB42_16460 [Deinococcus sp. D7000]
MSRRPRHHLRPAADLLTPGPGDLAPTVAPQHARGAFLARVLAGERLPPEALALATRLSDEQLASALTTDARGVTMTTWMDHNNLTLAATDMAAALAGKETAWTVSADVDGRPTVLATTRSLLHAALVAAELRT